MNNIELAPRIDVFENDEAFLILTDLPGVKPGDVDVTYERDTLAIRAKRAPAGDIGALISGEELLVDYARTFRVSGIEGAAIAAEMNGGVLKVHLPKAEDRKPRQIPINAG